MIRCVICGHGLREMIHFEPDEENKPYYIVDVCFECYDKMTKRKKENGKEIKKYIKFMKNDMAKAYGINKIRKK